MVRDSNSCRLIRLLRLAHSIFIRSWNTLRVGFIQNISDFHVQTHPSSNNNVFNTIKLSFISFPCARFTASYTSYNSLHTNHFSSIISTFQFAISGLFNFSVLRIMQFKRRLNESLIKFDLGRTQHRLGFRNGISI